LRPKFKYTGYLATQVLTYIIQQTALAKGHTYGFKD
jgi:hypothetical protein